MYRSRAVVVVALSLASTRQWTGEWVTGEWLTLAGVPLSSWSAWIHCCTAVAKWSLVLLLCMRGFRRSQPSKRQCTSQLSWLLTLCCAWFPLWFQREIDQNAAAEGIPLAHLSLAPENKSSTRPRVEYENKLIESPSRSPTLTFWLS